MAEETPSNGRAPFYGTLVPGREFYRRPGARLDEAEDPIARTAYASDGNRLAHRAFHRFDKAHQVMLAEEGIVPIEKAAANLRGLRDMEAEGEIDVRRSSGHDCHAGEAYLIEELGEETAGWIHAGRSTGDLFAVARRYTAREATLDLMDACLTLIEAYCDAAEEFKDAVMPNYTLHQHAQVGTFGWYLIGWERPIERSYRRFADLYGRVNESPAGLAAGTTTDFPIDRERTAELLGFEGIVDNAEDGLHADFDLRLEALSGATTLASSIAFAADRILLWNTLEYDLVDMPDRFFGTSSIMPQKRNPAAVRNVQGGASPVIGRLMEAYADARGMSGSPGVFVDVFEDITSQAEGWAKILRAVEFDRELAEERVYLDWALAADLAGTMAREAEIPWRWAHQITAILVRRSIEAGRDVREVTSEHVDEAAREYIGDPLSLDQTSIDEVIDARRAVEARSDVPGSPAPKQVDDQIERSRDRLQTWRDELRGRRSALEGADEKLDRAVDAIIGSDR